MNAVQQHVSTFLDQAADLFYRHQPWIDSGFVGPEIAMYPGHRRASINKRRRMPAQGHHGVIWCKRGSKVEQVAQRQGTFPKFHPKVARRPVLFTGSIGMDHAGLRNEAQSVRRLSLKGGDEHRRFAMNTRLRCPPKCVHPPNVQAQVMVGIVGQARLEVRVHHGINLFGQTHAHLTACEDNTSRIVRTRRQLDLR